MRIAHVADIHLKGLSRHDEVREVFQAFVNDARAQKVDHVFVAGDVFHTKTSGITPEYIDLMSWWLEELSTIGEIHIILGNHDGVLSNLSRQDAVSPIVNAIRNSKIHLYKDSGVYQFAPGFNWCVFSLFDEKSWSKVKPKKGDVNIACYHGPVWGAKTETDWKIDEGLKVDDFKEYDFAFLGDIHKFQYLGYRDCEMLVDKALVPLYPGSEVLGENGDKVVLRVSKPWIAYPGSTMQQNYAEDQQHGYLLWNIRSALDFDVEFRTLPNPKPFATIEWKNSVRETFDLARAYPLKSRFRIKHKDHLLHKDAIALTTSLKQDLHASEVVFKSDQQAITDYFHAGSTVMMKEDLRNPQILLKLMKEFYQESTVLPAEWDIIHDQIKLYLNNVSEEASIRNVAWSLKHLKFDNLFCYGEGNTINFQNLNGIVGIFGPNRSGKSSLPGTLMYTLFNATDRGSVKNLHVCNDSKQLCYSRAILSVNGVDYVIERQTTKNENKRGDVNAATALNFYRVDEGVELTDESGEARKDTDKTIRKYIGTSDDFMLTSFSTQGEINQVIELGSTKRNQMLSKFLDLDVFYKLYQLASKDESTSRATLKLLPDKDWTKLAQEKSKLISDIEKKIELLTEKLNLSRERLNKLQHDLLKHHNVAAVTPMQVEQQQGRVAQFKIEIDEITKKIQTNQNKIDKDNAKLLTIEGLKKDYDLDELRKRQESYRKLEMSVASLQHSFAREHTTLKQQKKSLKILKDVPCGDQYPACNFIKDAHQVKFLIDAQQEKVTSAELSLNNAKIALDNLKLENVDEKIAKLEKLSKLQSELLKGVSALKLENVKFDSMLSGLNERLNLAEHRLQELQQALQNDENVEVVAMRNEIDVLQRSFDIADREKLSLADKRGREVQAVEQLVNARQKRKEALQTMKLQELISVAFSKKGIPSIVLANKLPLINAELSKILSGIVDFSIELERDEESEQLEIFINYGDRRRLIELASGMEKSISSIALRVALINISSLPKTDFFIIDEGFGVFDDVSVEAVNRLLISLKRYFRVVFVITHIDAIKDVADHVLEITKSDKDSHVVFE